MTNRKSRKHSATAKKFSPKDLLSPFRYPGGKSWFIETAFKWLEFQKSRPEILVEPFGGGACISLAAVQKRLVSKVTFAEIDRDVAAAWKTILNGGAKWLSHEIASFSISRKRVEKELARNPMSQRRRAFRCILRNRTARGGVIAKGAGLIREGEDGNGLGSRWYPDTLVERIKKITALKSKIMFAQIDGFDLIQRYLRRKQAVFFVDPPYTTAARRLYSHWEIDHERLFEIMSRAKGAILMMYDDTLEIRNLAKKYGFQFKRISMRTTHHESKRELMISNSFEWFKIPRLENELTQKRRKTLF